MSDALSANQTGSNTRMIGAGELPTETQVRPASNGLLKAHPETRCICSSHIRGRE